MDVMRLSDQDLEYYIREYAGRIFNGIAIEESKSMLDLLFNERQVRKRSREQEDMLIQDHINQRAYAQGADPRTFVNNETINQISSPISIVWHLGFCTRRLCSEQNCFSHW